MKLLPLAIAVGLAANIDYALAAPVGVIIVSSGRRITVPADASGSVDPLSAYRFSPSSVGPHGKMPEGKFSAWWGLATPGPRIDVHPHKGGAGCGGRKASPVQSFRHIIDKVRAALGLPVAQYHGLPEWGTGKRYRLKVKADGSRHIEEVDTPPFKSFFTRFEHAMRGLSPWESWAVTFVLGCGIGALLRMFVVLGIILFRGRPAGQRCVWNCTPAEAEEPVAASAEAAPPAYTCKVDEKTPIMEESAPTAVESQKVPEGDVKEVETVEKAEDATLMVHWIHVDGSERVTAGSEFHEMYPRKLLAFYEANLKWRHDEEAK